MMGSDGAVFDGFPRTRGQAEGLDRDCNAGRSTSCRDRVPDDVFIDRLLVDGFVTSADRYTISSPSSGSRRYLRFLWEQIVQRADDTIESIHRRSTLR